MASYSSPLFEPVPIVMDESSPTVAVVGAGPGGLHATKELKEHGFQVTCFEMRSEVGGIWTFSEDPTITSTTLKTIVQTSKSGTCISDFAMPEDFPNHVPAVQMSEYYKAYSKYFELYGNIVFGVKVVSLKRDHANAKWLLQIEGERTLRSFDKVVWASGPDVIARHPNIEGLEKFAGTYIHCQAFKHPEEFTGKSVLVLGIGNSAPDVAVELVPHASKIYISHRHGQRIVSRTSNEGIPVDAPRTWRVVRFLTWIEYICEPLYCWIIGKVLAKSMKDRWGHFKPEWGLDGAPPITEFARAMSISDDLIPRLHDGRIISVPGISKILGPKSVELDNGAILEDLDAIIACTGYDQKLDFTNDLRMTAIPIDQQPEGYRVPELYMNFIPPDYADSLAFLNWTFPLDSAAIIKELAAMAIAQIWVGHTKLPSPDKMRAQVKENERWWLSKGLTFPGAYKRWTRSWEVANFLHKAAGTGMVENLGWSWAAWKFWWTDKNLYNMIVWGRYCPHSWRFFETGKRKAWPGARGAIISVNEEFESRYGQVAKGSAKED